MELTQQHLDTFTHTANAVNNLTVTVSGMVSALDKMNQQLFFQAEVLEAHTKTLDALAKNTINWNYRNDFCQNAFTNSRSVV